MVVCTDFVFDALTCRWPLRFLILRTTPKILFSSNNCFGITTDFELKQLKLEKTGPGEHKMKNKKRLLDVKDLKFPLAITCLSWNDLQENMLELKKT